MTALCLVLVTACQLHTAWWRSGGRSDPRGSGHLQEGGAGGGGAGAGRGVRPGGRQVPQQAVRLPVHHQPGGQQGGAEGGDDLHPA